MILFDRHVWNFAVDARVSVMTKTTLSLGTVTVFAIEHAALSHLVAVFANGWVNTLTREVASALAKFAVLKATWLSDLAELHKFHVS